MNSGETTQTRWNKINNFIAFIKERFNIALDKQATFNKWSDVLEYCRTKGDTFDTLVESDAVRIAEIVIEFEEAKPKKRRTYKKNNNILTNDGDKLKVAFWFIARFETPEEALRVMRTAVNAHKELSCAS